MVKRTESTNYEINLDASFESFYKHFNIEANKRILFSAPFGFGKTHFLKRFFDDFINSKDAESQYEYIRLSPVNYVPSDNVTVFELIKG